MIENKKHKISFAVSLVLIQCVLLYATYLRNNIWESELSLLGDVVRKTHGKARIHNNFGFAYEALGMPDKAIEQYQIAVKLYPYYHVAYYNMGNAYWSKGQLEKAIEQYLIALRLYPGFVRARENLSQAFQLLGAANPANNHIGGQPARP